MGQVTIYLDKKTEEKARQAAKHTGKSLSSWVSEAVREKTGNEWPDIVRSLAGSMPDFPEIEELRKDLGADVPREGL